LENIKNIRIVMVVVVSIVYFAESLLSSSRQIKTAYIITGALPTGE